MNYELFISLRYLRARRRETFISLITLISILGVMLAVMTLNVVMAVMTGFEETLRDRLLGINAHINLDLGVAAIEALDDRGVFLVRGSRHACAHCPRLALRPPSDSLVRHWPL